MAIDTSNDIKLYIRHMLQSLHDNPHFKASRDSDQRNEMDKLLHSFIFRFFYYIISNDGELLPLLFTSTPKEEFPKTLDEAVNLDLLAQKKTRAFYTIDELTVNSIYSHIGRNCGRKFQPGEPIYRCQECSFDDTCVLCIHCFNPKDHVSHHVYTNICTEFNNGICDCGDKEAWNTNLCCRSEEMEGSLDCDRHFESENISNLFEIVLSELFDHFVDVFNQNIEPLPTIQKDLTLKLKEMEQQKQIAEEDELLENLAYTNEYIESGKTASPNVPLSLIVQNEHNESKDYAVLIYNDEYHNYSQASSAIRRGLSDTKHIDLLTARIDGEGRAMLKCSSDFSTIIDGFFSVQTNGLSATLISWSEYIHQEISKYMIRWVNHCLTLPNTSFQKVFRDVLGKVLCSPYNLKRTTDMTFIIDKYFSSKFEDNYIYKYTELSVLSKGNTIPLGHHKQLLDTNIDYISLNLNEVEQVKKKQYINSRLQFILFFDNRYWKKLRQSVQDLIIPTLSSSLKYKTQFCYQLVEIFNHMTRSLAFMDREPQLTALRECVVQLFTCPTNSRNILENGSFIDIIWSVIDIFTEFSKVESGVLVWQRIQRSNPTKSYSISFKQGLYAIETILSKIDDARFILDPKTFVSIVTLCKLFNGVWKIKRKEGEHVLREDQNFIPYLEYTTSIYSIIRTLEKILEKYKATVDEDMISNAIYLLNTFLGHRTLSYRLVMGTHDIIKFKVSKQRVAFMNPVHTLFSFLFEKVPLKKAFEAIHDCRDFLIISDFSLRSVILCSQIDVGFWVRNGISVLHQSSFYKNNPELGSYSRCIHLNQLALLRENEDLSRVIYNMLDRWEILQWYSNEVEFDDTVYEDKIVQILQQFISFTYRLLTERQFFRKFNFPSEKQAYNIRRSIIYCLHVQPLSYSNLLKSVPSYLSESTSLFDNILQEVSIYIEPKGLEDSGTFRLKKELYNQIDPMQLLNMENDFEHSAIIIKSNIAINPENARRVILHPQIIPPKYLDEAAIDLGAFSRTNVFAKLIYKLLQVCLDKEESGYIYELLHLIHGIFKDDELVNGKSSLPECYISKPICNLLLAIVDSKSNIFSEHVINKSDYLLETMILKRPTEIFDSLVTCFGQEYVNNYKAKKLNQGVNFEESEKELKKRIIQERKQKIMTKFAKQQSKFLKGNKEDFEKTYESIDIGSNKHTQIDELTCSLCQDSTSPDSFVIPVYHENSPIFLSGDIEPSAYCCKWDGFYNDDSPTVYKNNIMSSLRDAQNGATKVFVSCNHYIHYECFKRYIQKKRFSSNLFICPLCQTFSNCVLPIYPLDTLCDSGTVSLFGVSDKIGIERFIGKSISTNTEVQMMFKEISKQNQNFDKKYCNDNISCVPYILSYHWANTIAMIEISSRIEKNPYRTLLIRKEQKLKTLKNVLNSIMWVYTCFDNTNYSGIPYMNATDNKNPINGPFQYIVNATLFSNRPLNDIVYEALSVWVKHLIASFGDYFQKNSIRDMYDHLKSSGTLYQVDELHLSALKKNCDLKETTSALDDMKMYSVIYTMLIKNITPTLRRCVIMLKVMDLLASRNHEMVIDDVNVETGLDYVCLPLYFTQLIKLITKHTLLDIILNSETIIHTNTTLKHLGTENVGIIKLVNLAKHLNTYVTNSREIKLKDEYPQQMKNVDNRLDFKICLTCGIKVHTRKDNNELIRHMTKNCFATFGLFLIPNKGEICLILTNPRSHISSSAPYLNLHGESGRNAIQRGDLTTLNLTRYEHLNRLWLNNEIPGYISRIMGDEFRVSIISNGMVFNFNRNVLRRPLRINPGDESSEEDLLRDIDGIDDDNELEWGVETEELFRNGVIQLGRPGQTGDIRDFFQFITNLRADGQDGFQFIQQDMQNLNDDISEEQSENDT